MHAAFVLNGFRFECKRQKEGSKPGTEEWYMVEDMCTRKITSMKRKEFLIRLRDELRKSGATEVLRNIYSIYGIEGV